MSTSLEEGYKMFKTQETWRSDLHPVAGCIFDDYRLGIDGLEDRNKIRATYPNVYKDLKEVRTLEDFIEVVGRVKLHLFTKER